VLVHENNIVSSTGLEVAYSLYSVQVHLKKGIISLLELESYKGN